MRSSLSAPRKAENISAMVTETGSIRPQQGYGCGLHLMAVMADGNIAKCSFYGDQPVGTVDHGLQTAWGKIQPGKA